MPRLCGGRMKTPLITAENGAINLDTEDEVVVAMLLTRNGATVSERLK